MLTFMPAKSIRLTSIQSDMQHVATIRCKCGWKTECEVESQKAAEILAERHEMQFMNRRAYRHDANVITLEAI